MCGAKIVFSDIQSDTGNIDPLQIEEKITSRTKAIVAVDYAGHPADLDEIRKICDKYNLIFIEDASHALGSKYKNNYVGSIADITTFSFFPTKNITTGEGGAIACKDPQILQKARRFARQGLIREKSEFKITTEGPWHQEVHQFGLNYRLPDILAALGSSQLERFDEFKFNRQQIWNFYNLELKKNPYLKLPAKKDFVDPFWHLYSLKIPPKLRLDFFNHMRRNNINVQVNYFPVHLQPVFRSSKSISNLNNSIEYYNGQISLPIYSELGSNQQMQIIEVINKFRFDV
jgi:dTDP-4-amino-4,6-dideoxygalactose transaminase